jgi:hypothetical protein
MFLPFDPEARDQGTASLTGVRRIVSAGAKPLHDAVYVAMGLRAASRWGPAACVYTGLTAHGVAIRPLSRAHMLVPRRALDRRMRTPYAKRQPRQPRVSGVVGDGAIARTCAARSLRCCSYLRRLMTAAHASTRVRSASVSQLMPARLIRQFSFRPRVSFRHLRGHLLALADNSDAPQPNSCGEQIAALFVASLALPVKHGSAHFMSVDLSLSRMWFR